MLRRPLSTILGLIALTLSAGVLGYLALISSPALQLRLVQALVPAVLGYTVSVGQVTRFELKPDYHLGLADIRIRIGSADSAPQFIEVSNLSLTGQLRDLARADRVIDSVTIAGMNLATEDALQLPPASGSSRPLIINHLLVKDSRFTYRDSDQHVQLDIASLQGAWGEGAPTLQLNATLNGEPMRGTLNVDPTGDVFSLNGELSWGVVEATLSSTFNSLNSIVPDRLNLKIASPESLPLLALLGVQEMREGSFEVNFGLKKTSLMDFNLTGLLSGISFSIDGQVDGVEPRAISYRLNGPSLKEAGSLFNEFDFADLPFTLTGEMSLDSDGLHVRDNRLTAGKGNMLVSGRLPAFPDIDGWIVDVSGDGIGLDVLEPLAGSCDLPDTPLDWRGQFRSDQRNLETVDLSITGPHNINVKGVVGGLPSLNGTDLGIVASGLSLQLLSGCFKLDLFADVSPAAVARLLKHDDGWQVTDATLVAAGLSATASAKINDHGDGLLKLEMQTSDLSKLIVVNRPELIDGMSVTANIQLSGQRSNIIVDEARFEVNDQPGRITGKLGDLGRMEDMDLMFEFEGDDLARHLEVAGHRRLPYSVKGRLGNENGAWQIGSMDLKLAGAELGGSATLTGHPALHGSSINLNGNGADLLRILPPNLLANPGEALPFSLVVQLTVLPEGIQLSGLDIEVSGHHLRGELDVNRSTAETTGEIALTGDNLKSLVDLFSLPLITKPEPYNISAAINGSKTRVTLAPISLRSGQSLVEGSALWQSGTRPSLDIDLRSPYFSLTNRFDEAAESYASKRSVRQTWNPDLSQYEDDLTVEEASEKLLTDKPLPLDWLSAIDGTLKFQSDEFYLRDDTYTSLDAAFTLLDGRLTSDRFVWTGDRLRGEASLDIQNLIDETRIEFQFSGPRFPLLWLVTGLPDSHQDSEYYAHLKSSGSSTLSLARNLSGNFLMRGSGGRLNTDRLDALFGDFLYLLTNRLLKNKQEMAKVSCMAGGAVINNGTVSFKPGFAIRTTNLDLMTTGSLNIAKESMDLTLSTRSRKGIGFSPVKALVPRSKIGGTFANPIYRVDSAAAAASGGAALATSGLTLLASGIKDRFLTSTRNPCDDVWAEAKTATGLPVQAN